MIDVVAIDKQHPMTAVNKLLLDVIVKGESADCYMKKVSAESSETVTAVTSRVISGNRDIVRVQNLNI